MAQVTFNGGTKPSTGFVRPSSPAKPAGAYIPNYDPPAAAKPRNPGTADAPSAPTFKPYEPYKPYKPGSLFGPDGRPKS